jgi:hypothetical protein
MRRAFPFAGILFEEYNGSVTLSNGTSERLIPTGEGIAFPLGHDLTPSPPMAARRTCWKPRIPSACRFTPAR